MSTSLLSWCHQPPTTINPPTNRHLETRTDQQCLVGILPQNSQHQVQPRNHEINVGFGFRLFLLISPKKCWDVGFYVDPDFFYWIDFSYQRIFMWIFLSNNVQILPIEVESPHVSVIFSHWLPHGVQTGPVRQKPITTNNSSRKEQTKKTMGVSHDS